MWTDADDSALLRVFDLVWDFWTTEFEVLGYTTSWWQILVTVFGIFLVFKIARGIFEI